ncbi:hypothetical protein, partial [Massilia timonae]|uniref:hypothetical protein n=1 Tax=Massilia timonae TaxID=47229 RepID=UPI002356D576
FLWGDYRRPFDHRVNTAIAALLPAIIFGAQATAFLYSGEKGLELKTPRWHPKSRASGRMSCQLRSSGSHYQASVIS